MQVQKSERITVARAQRNRARTCEDLMELSPLYDHDSFIPLGCFASCVLAMGKNAVGWAPVSGEIAPKPCGRGGNSDTVHPS